MSELKDKELEQVKGGIFIPTLESNFVPDDLDEPVNEIKDEPVNLINDENPNININAGLYQVRAV